MYPSELAIKPFLKGQANGVNTVDNLIRLTGVAGPGGRRDLKFSSVPASLAKQNGE